MDNQYDSMLVLVDRFSGWILAIPTKKFGLTGEKAAHLVMERGWDIFGIPQIISSDQGPHFANQFWRTLCGRLGIRQAFSHAHRPQGNGRAEVAGKSLQTILRKMHEERSINWVEALPHAVRVHNNFPNTTGLSPYKILFGRDRLDYGLPYTHEMECEEASQFFDRMQKIDNKVYQHMVQDHHQQRERYNATKKEKADFQIGDWVWILRQRSADTKFETWWTGPAQILR